MSAPTWASAWPVLYAAGAEEAPLLVVGFCLSLASAWVARGLKHVIKQPRPPDQTLSEYGAFGWKRARPKAKSPHGMPSTHCCVTGFATCYGLLWFARALIVRQGALARAMLLPGMVSLVRAGQAAIVILPLAMVGARVQQKRHTLAQCLVGIALGLGLGGVAFHWLYRDR